MKASVLVLFAVGLLLSAAGVVGASEGLPGQGLFTEYRRFFSGEPAWAATVGGKFEVLRWQELALAFEGRIDTVSELPIDLSRNISLTDVCYRLEPRVVVQALYASLNHWSFHKADAPGTRPNLNLVTVGFDRRFGRFALNAGVNYKTPGSSSTYAKAAFLHAEEWLDAEARRGVHARLSVEAFPEVIAAVELGWRARTAAPEVLKAFDLFAGWHFGPARILSSQYGLASSGPYAGFRLVF